MEYKTHLAAAKQELGAKQLELEQATELREAATLDAYRAQQQVEQKDQQVQQKDHHIQQKDQQIQQKEHQVQQKEHRHQVWSSTHAFTMLRQPNYHITLLDVNAAICLAPSKKLEPNIPTALWSIKTLMWPTRSTYTIGSTSGVFYFSVK